MNDLSSPWVLDDLTEIVTEIGDRLEVVMVPKVEGAVGHPLRRPAARPARGERELERPILIHAILETALGVANLEEIACAAPRIQGMSFGPADLAASRRMKTTRVGGGHPGYRTIADPDADAAEAPRAEPPAGPVALLDRADGRRLHVGRRPPVLWPIRRHPRPRGLRDPVPRLVPARLRRRVVASPGADRDREEGLRPTPTRSRSRRR